ncbi:ankyrin repeat-containing protein [Anaeramoeba flamelloides]|uniref:Ankyrin repeat-containing protein n=1 Tax=Anaeramoeba flamelloides TaxID=1746091 RepID=A0AAV7Z8M5_9EUKA|nr:ankyrin repeat-containing protein [Anaeramoeba flamelloides]
MFSKIIKAVQGNDLGLVEKFVETQSTSELNKRNTNKRTLLHECVKNKCTLEILEYLLKKGCDPNVPDAIGNTVAYEAILNSCGVDYIKLLFDNGYEIDHRNYGDRSILLYTIEQGNNYPSNELIELIEYFLSLGASLCERIGDYRDSIPKEGEEEEEDEENKKFRKYVKKRHLGEVEINAKYEEQLKEEKKEEEKQKEFEKDRMLFVSTSPMFSSRCRRTKKIKPFSYLKLQNYPAERFLEQYDTFYPDHKFSTHKENLLGCTILHLSFFKRLDAKVIEYICKKMPDMIWSLNDKGELPLHIACQHYNSYLLTKELFGNYLLEMDIQDVFGRTPFLRILMKQSDEEQIQLINYFLEKKINFQTQDVIGWNCLHFAAYSKYPIEIMKNFTSLGVKVNYFTNLFKVDSHFINNTNPLIMKRRNKKIEINKNKEETKNKKQRETQMDIENGETQIQPKKEDSGDLGTNQMQKEKKEGISEIEDEDEDENKSESENESESEDDYRNRHRHRAYILPFHQIPSFFTISLCVKSLEMESLHKQLKKEQSKKEQSKKKVETLQKEIRQKKEIDFGHFDQLSKLYQKTRTTPEIRSGAFTFQNEQNQQLFELNEESIRYKFSPLHYLVINNGNTDIIKYLVNKIGIDINSCDNFGLTALHYACIFNVRKEIIQTLIDLKIDVNKKGKQGMQALHLLCWMNGNPESVKLLLQCGANTNSYCLPFGTTRDGQYWMNNKDETHRDRFPNRKKYLQIESGTALHFLSCNFYPKIKSAEYLIKFGNAKINAMTETGYLPIHLASYCCRSVEYFNLLKLHGSHLDQKCKLGFTPFALLLTSYHQLNNFDCIKFFIDNKINLFEKFTKLDDTYLHLYCRNDLFTYRSSLQSFCSHLFYQKNPGFNNYDRNPVLNSDSDLENVYYNYNDDDDAGSGSDYGFVFNSDSDHNHDSDKYANHGIYSSSYSSHSNESEDSGSFSFSFTESESESENESENESEIKSKGQGKSESENENENGLFKGKGSGKENKNKNENDNKNDIIIEKEEEKSQKVGINPQKTKRKRNRKSTNRVISLKVIEYLISCGFSPNTKNYNNETILNILLMRNGISSKVIYRIATEKNINIKSNIGFYLDDYSRSCPFYSNHDGTFPMGSFSQLFGGISSESEDVGRKWLSPLQIKCVNYRVMRRATSEVKRYWKNLLKTFVILGANINETDKKGRIPLCYLISSGLFYFMDVIIKIFIKMGTNINHLDYDNWSLLDHLLSNSENLNAKNISVLITQKLINKKILQTNRKLILHSIKDKEMYFRRSRFLITYSGKNFQHYYCFSANEYKSFLHIGETEENDNRREFGWPLERPRQIPSVNNNGQTMGNSEKKIKEEKKEKEEEKEIVGYTPLHQICFSNSSDGYRTDIIPVMSLLKNGANPNAQDIFDFTPLHILLSRNNYHKESYQATKRLIEYKANLNSTDWKGSTPLHFAAALKSYYINYKEKYFGRRNKHRYYGNIDKKRHIKQINEYHLRTVKLLLQNGAQINVKNEYNEIPLHFACKGQSQLEVIKLLSTKENIHIKSKFDNYAKKSEIKKQMKDFKFKILRYQHRYNNDHNRRNRSNENNKYNIENGFTPFGFAIENSSFEVIKYLLDLGSDPNHEDPYGETAIFGAVLNKDSRVLEHLLNHNLIKNVTHLNNDNQNCLINGINLKAPIQNIKLLLKKSNLHLSKEYIIDSIIKFKKSDDYLLEIIKLFLNINNDFLNERFITSQEFLTNWKSCLELLDRKILYKRVFNNYDKEYDENDDDIDYHPYDYGYISYEKKINTEKQIVTGWKIPNYLFLYNINKKIINFFLNYINNNNNNTNIKINSPSIYFRMIPLHFACLLKYNINLMKNLIKMGSLIDKKDRYLRTPFHYLFFKTTFESKSNSRRNDFLLYDREIKENKQSKKKKNQEKLFEFTKLFLENGADPNSIDIFNYTPLEYSIKNNLSTKKLIDLFLDYNGDFHRNVKDEKDNDNQNLKDNNNNNNNNIENNNNNNNNDDDYIKPVEKNEKNAFDILLFSRKKTDIKLLNYLINELINKNTKEMKGIFNNCMEFLFNNQKHSFIKQLNYQIVKRYFDNLIEQDKNYIHNNMETIINSCLIYRNDFALFEYFLIRGLNVNHIFTESQNNLLHIACQKWKNGLPYYKNYQKQRSDTITEKRIEFDEPYLARGSESELDLTGDSYSSFLSDSLSDEYFNFDNYHHDSSYSSSSEDDDNNTGNISRRRRGGSRRRDNYDDSNTNKKFKDPNSKEYKKIEEKVNNFNQERLKIIILILEKIDKKYINQSNELSQTPVLLACISKLSIKIIQLLIKNGADVNLPESLKQTKAMENGFFYNLPFYLQYQYPIHTVCKKKPTCNYYSYS